MTDPMKQYAQDVEAWIAAGSPDDSVPVLPGAYEPEPFVVRLERIAGEIELGMGCSVRVARDVEIPQGRFFFQITCWRRDVVTGEMGYGYGGKAYLSEHASDSELVQTIFGLYRAYWEHEARETFSWKGRRVFGPHISTEALWDVARRVDIRSARHTEDQK